MASRSIPASGARPPTREAARSGEAPPSGTAAAIEVEERQLRKERSRIASAITARMTDFFNWLPLIKVGDVIEDGRVELHLIEQVRADPDDVQVVLGDDAGHR